MLDHSVFGYAFIGFGQVAGDGARQAGPSGQSQPEAASGREAGTGLLAWLRSLLRAR